MLTQNCRDFLTSLGYFSEYKTLFVRAFAAKKMPLADRLTYNLAYRKNTQILPLSPMGSIHLETNTYLPANGFNKGTSQPNGWEIIRKQNAKPQGLYFTVNPGGQDIVDITESTCLFYEIDNLSKAEQWEKLRALETELGITLGVVETRNSLHIYLPLRRPIKELDQWSRFQQRLIQKMDSDSSIHNLNRVMRLPDFDYWEWSETLGSPVNHGRIELRQLAHDRVDIEQLHQLLPAWSEERWKPVRSAGIAPLKTSPKTALDYWDMTTIRVYLEGYNANGRQNGWATARCPVQGPGHSGSPSLDSLHIAQDGSFKCHAGCSSSDVMKAAMVRAVAMGHPTFEAWAISHNLMAPPVEAALPGRAAVAPPVTAFPDFFDSASLEPDQFSEADLGVAPVTPVAIATCNPEIPVAEDPNFAHEYGTTKTDGLGTTLLGAAIRSLQLSDEGEDLVGTYVWVMVSNEYWDLETQVKLKAVQLQQAFDGKVAFFQKEGRPVSNWVKLPQGDKPKKVGIIELLDAHCRVAFDYGYAPGGPPLIPPTGKERFPRVNLWKPTPRGLVGATLDDVAPWLDRLYKLLPGAAGDYFLQFLAHTVTQPHIKCDWAPILYTQKRRSGREQFLAPVIALFNAVNQGAEIQCTGFDPRYTDALISKRLVLLNEVKRPTGREFSNPDHWLKNLIGHTADPNKIYTRKTLTAITMPDFTNYILLTNEQDAVTIMEDEGRYWPVETTWKGEESEYEILGDFYANGGFQKIWGYLYTVDLTGFSPWRPNLELSNFAEFCGATEADARALVLDYLEGLPEPFMAHAELKGQFPNVLEIQDGRSFRKLIANSRWTMTSARTDRVSWREGRNRVQSHLIYATDLGPDLARSQFYEAKRGVLA